MPQAPVTFTHSPLSDEDLELRTPEPTPRMPDHLSDPNIGERLILILGFRPSASTTRWYEHRHHLLGRPFYATATTLGQPIIRLRAVGRREEIFPSTSGDGERVMLVEEMHIQYTVHPVEALPELHRAWLMATRSDYQAGLDALGAEDPSTLDDEEKITIKRKPPGGQGIKFMGLWGPSVPDEFMNHPREVFIRVDSPCQRGIREQAVNISLCHADGVPFTRLLEFSTGSGDRMLNHRSGPRLRLYENVDRERCPFRLDTDHHALETEYW